MFYWVLFLTLNIQGVQTQTFQGAFHTKEECVEAGEKFTQDKYFDSFQCKGKVD